MNRSSQHLAPNRSAGGLQKGLCLVAALSPALVATCLSISPAHAVTIDWVTVGNPGNSNDTTGYGAVNYEYRIGKYEVTIQQYTDFLNAVAKSDPYGLYNSDMNNSKSMRGIQQNGESGSYSYTVVGPNGTNPPGAQSPGNRPISWVSWWDAARFANWMHNGQGNGSTETGAYTLNGATGFDTAPARNPGALFYIPTENEWYKAAFYSPSKGGPTTPGYFAYGTQSDLTPGNGWNGSTALASRNSSNQANYRITNFQVSGRYAVTGNTTYIGGSSDQNALTDVGAFANSTSFYGAFDMSGNVNEWNDLTGAADSSRGSRGGDWGVSEYGLSSGARSTAYPSSEGALGFRLASPVPVPEPSTWVMGAGGLICAVWQAFRRR